MGSTLESGSPEDDRVSQRDYGLQMRMLRFLSGHFGGLKDWRTP